jgi:hypothetical protein
MESDKEPSEADFNGSCSEPSQAQNEGSDGGANFGQRGHGSCSRSCRSFYRLNDDYDKAFLDFHVATLAEVAPAVDVYNPRTYF